MNSDISNICRKMWKLEKDFLLFEKKIKNIYFWKLVRFPVFNKIAIEQNIYKKAHTYKKKNFWIKMYSKYLRIINTVFYNILRNKNPVDILIFVSRNKKFNKERKNDIYSEGIRKEVENKNYEFVEHLITENKYNKNYICDDHFSFYWYVKKKFNLLNLNQKENMYVNEIEKLIKNSFNISIDIKSLIVNKILNFQQDYAFYKKVFKIRKVKKIYITCSYGKEALIEAAKKKNVESIELQHGTINKYHMGYSYPDIKNIPYFPDKLYLFGKFWKESTPLPIKDKNIKYYGFEYLKMKYDKYKNVDKNKKQIIFISQGTIGKKLSKMAYNFSKKNKKYDILYKLHPGEIERWENDYPDLINADKLKNFKLIKSNNKTIHEYLSKSEYQIGVYSTAIYEGLIFNCKTILLDLPGIDYMRYLLQNNIAFLVKDANGILDVIKNKSFNKINKQEFFSNFDKK